MQLIVKGKSSFGVLNASDGAWYNPKEKEMLSTFTVGKAYEVELAESKGKNGKTYKNIVSAREVQLDAPPENTANEKETQKPRSFARKPFTPKEDRATGSGLSFAEKDERILVQGLTQAVINSPVLSTADIETLEPLVRSLVDMVKRVSKI